MHWIRMLMWSVMGVLAAIIIFAGFTEAGDLISAPSNLKVLFGCILIALMVSAIIAAILSAVRHYRVLASRAHPDRPIRVVPTRRPADD